MSAANTGVIDPYTENSTAKSRKIRRKSATYKLR
jgi:hypothetical protein